MAHNRRQGMLICAGLVLLTIATFAPVRHFGFVDYDDGLYVSKNEVVLGGFTREGVRWAFSAESVQPTANWHPLTWLSLMADVSLFGANPSAMHVVNVAIHAGNVLLLYWMLVAATRRRYRSAFVAVIFAVHPLHVESVAWISERKDVLSTLFALLSMRCYFRWQVNRRILWQILSILAFLFSLLTKQMYVTLPFLLLLLHYWPLGRAGTTRPTNSEEQTVRGLRLVKDLWPFFVGSIVFCGLAVIGQKEGGAVAALEDYPLGQRIYNAVIVYVLYILQTLWPTRLAVYYPYPLHIPFLTVLPCLAVLLGATVFAVRKRNADPAVLVGWLWYLGTLVPVIGIVQIGTQRMADRYMYFPMVGLTIAGTWFVADRVAAQPRFRKVVVSCAAAAALILAVLARQQVAYWKDTMTLFTRAADVAESGLALANVAHEYEQKGELDKANIYALRAIRLDPASASTRSLLGTLALAENRPKDAEDWFRQSLQIRPNSAETHYNLGLTLVRQGRPREAISSYTQALELNQDKPDVRTNLAVAYSMLEEDQAAMEQFEIVLAKFPDFPQANFNYAKLLMKTGAVDRAIPHLESVARTTPQMWQTYSSLAEIYVQKQDAQKAREYAEKALQLSNGAPEILELMDIVNQMP
ncbi:TPR repeat-containing protein YrrB [Fuerstiella marisgermanici]|uniref:TPR repeat-containing protein YrrB n=2 Tax=Fuerstiella marisgermanici TaxID=1891926 RepID=A0A1P8WNN2_9PLAN|nr:TPR repeat-containing protein YrrB [Fuerstiella marisgermanici]